MVATDHCIDSECTSHSIRDSLLYEILNKKVPYSKLLQGTLFL